MSKSVKTFLKVVALNAFVIVSAVFCYSPGLLALTFSVIHPFVSAFFVSSLIGLIGIFFYGNYSLLCKKEDLILVKRGDLKTMGDLVDMLEDLDEKCFRKQIARAKQQVVRLDGKVDTLKSMLKQQFDPQEMSYQSFMGTVGSVVDMFTDNVQNMRNRIMIFDYDDYRYLAKEKKTIPKVYSEHIQFTEDMLASNDTILERLDSLLLEVSKLHDTASDIDKLPAMKELERLIETTKYYKQ